MKKWLATLLLIVVSLTTACSSQNSVQEPEDNTSDAVETRIASLKGPTSMGLAFMLDTKEGSASQMYTAADEIVPLIAKGEVDIALIPANLAATLYQKTEGAISVIDINTLGVLEVITANEGVSSIADLKGKTVYMMGKGTTPEYALRYIMEKNGLALEDFELSFKSEATEVVSALTESPDAVGILPQPFATVAMTQIEGVKNPIHLGQAWSEVSDDGSELVTGVTVVRNEFLNNHPDKVKQFLQEHAESVEAVNQRVTDAAARIELLGIVKAQVAEKAIPACNLVCITGGKMKAALSGYLQALYEMAPETVGGKLPDEAFYYLGE